LGRVGRSIQRWFNARREECVHCRECGNEVSLVASHCPSCGQANPAKVSLSAAVYLAIAFAAAALALSCLIAVW
jgi:hypothetical protein